MKPETWNLKLSATPLNSSPQLRPAELLSPKPSPPKIPGPPATCEISPLSSTQGKKLLLNPLTALNCSSDAPNHSTSAQLERTPFSQRHSHSWFSGSSPEKLSK